MKNLLCVIFLLSLSTTASAQITITQSDMAQPNDAFIITNALVDVTIDPEETGANHSWDFQNVIPLSSNADSFYDESGLPLVYQLFFFGSNLAEKTGYSVSFSGFTLDDVYNVYKNSSSSFQQSGYAGTFDGIPVPIAYNSKDVIYKFPLQFGNVDSSASDFTFSLPGFAFISQQRERVNRVDGWGMVTTPIGTFNVLRVKSTITDEDSVFLDTLNFGTHVVLKSYEYKWLAQGTGVPVFQINAQDLLGSPVITQMLYEDTTLHTAVAEIPSQPNRFITVFPNPAYDRLQIQFPGESDKSAAIIITNASGDIIYRSTILNANSTIDISNWRNGIYFLQLMKEDAVCHAKIVVQH